MNSKIVNKTMKVKMLSPNRRMYEGPAVSVTATNSIGIFDVLAGHANFFSLLKASDVVINTGEQKLSFPINSGLIKVKSDMVTLFVDIEST